MLEKQESERVAGTSIAVGIGTGLFIIALSGFTLIILDARDILRSDIIRQSPFGAFACLALGAGLGFLSGSITSILYTSAIERRKFRDYKEEQELEILKKYGPQGYHPEFGNTRPGEYYYKSESFPVEKKPKAS